MYLYMYITFPKSSSDVKYKHYTSWVNTKIYFKKEKIKKNITYYTEKKL